MNAVIKILLAEHDVHDLEMIDTELKRGGVDFVSEIVKNETNYRKAIRDFIPDIILCDYSFPSFDGATAFKIREEIAPETPFILVSGTIGEEKSVELIKNGVTDFVLKDKIFTLNTKLVRALNEAKERKEKSKAEQELKQSEARLVKAQAIAKIGSWQTDLINLQVKWSEETYTIFEVDRHNFEPSHAAFLQMIHPQDMEEVNLAFQTSFSRHSVNTIEHRILTPTGQLKYVEECWQILFDEQDKPLTAVGTCQDITERKKNEAAINKAYIEKNMVLESIDDGFFATDKNSIVTYWNRKAELLLEVKKEDILGKDLHEVFAGSRSPVFYENYQNALRDNSTIRFEGFSNRTNKWFAVSAFASDNGLSVYFKDVTEQKNAEEKLIKSELRYRSLIEESTDLILMADISRKIFEINPSGCKMLGYSREEILQLYAEDLLFEEDLETNPIKDEESKDGITIHNIRNFKRKDGSGIQMEVNGMRMHDGNGFVVFGRDITQRKESERLIKESEAKYRSFFMSSMDGILLTVTDGAILSANPAACEIFKMTEAEICAAGRMGLVDLSDPRVYSLLEEGQLTGKAKGELTLLRKDGSKFEAELSSAVFTDSYGMDRTSMIVRDISERKAAELTLHQTTSELQHTLHDLTKIMDSSMDIICTVDGAGKFVQMSAASETIWGYSPREVINMNYTDFLYADDIEKSTTKNSELKDGAPVTMFENRFVHKNGSIVPMLWSANWDEHDQLMYCIGKDATGQKRLEKANEMERRRFLSLYSQTPSTMGILKGPNHVFEMANPPYMQLIGKSNIIGKPVKEVLPELETQGLLKILDNVYKTGETFLANEMPVQHHRDGSENVVVTYLDLMYLAHRDSDDIIDGILFFAIDVTEQVVSRKKIEESEKRYRQIVETAQEGIWLIDENHTTTFVNNKLCEILEYSEAEIMGKEIFCFMDEEGKQIATGLMEKKKQGYAGQDNFKYISKTGKDIWTNMSANPLFYEDGTYQGSLAMITDITQSIKAKKRDQFQATLLNTIGQAAIATDMQGNINFWNKAASSIYGWAEEEVLGKSIMEIIPAQQTKEQAGQLVQALLLGNSWSGEFKVRRKDGGEFLAFVTNSPIYDHLQQQIGIIGVSSDITERKNAELQLNVMNENLQKQAKALASSNAELEQFAYVASHDLQEPLRMVTSYLSLIENKYSSDIDDKGKKYISFALDGSRRMRTIILDLLEFSRVGRLDGVKEKVDLNELIKEIQLLLQKQMAEKKARIHCQHLPVLYTEKTPLLQVIKNLLSNALKYAKEETPVCIDITATESKDQWQFAVRDNGIGISAKFFDKIFIIFQRLHNKDEYSGTGIGLAVVKKIVESRGGKIWVESERGVGSTFYFTMLKAAMT